jgi:hypothetical protein
MYEKIAKILSYYGISVNDLDYLFYRDNLIAMRNAGYSYRSMEDWLVERLEYEAAS